VYWAGLDRLNKKHKETFTKFAVGYLARQQAAEGNPIYLKHVPFDAQNTTHVAEVLRVFFGPEVVSCGIVLCAYDARDRSMQVLREDYAVYRPSAQHRPSVVARAVHGLDAAALASGEDIAALHARLLNIIEQHPAVVFVAHYAPHDRGVLLESIDRSTLDTQNLPYKAHLLRLRRELQDAHRWTSTWQRSVFSRAASAPRPQELQAANALRDGDTHPAARTPQRADRRLRLRGDPLQAARLRR
jgi:hypothetical protein